MSYGLAQGYVRRMDSTLTGSVIDPSRASAGAAKEQSSLTPPRQVDTRCASCSRRVWASCGSADLPGCASADWHRPDGRLIGSRRPTYQALALGARRIAACAAL